MEILIAVLVLIVLVVVVVFAALLAEGVAYGVVGGGDGVNDALFGKGLQSAVNGYPVVLVTYLFFNGTMRQRILCI